jgi:multiple antibiotic resistance protein
MKWFAHFFEVLVPVFVAMGPLTVLPIFLSMTEGMELTDARVLARRAVITAGAVGIAIVLVGQALFRFLAITVDDLRIAGGIILLLIAIHDLIFTRERRKISDMGSDAGVVPLGTPLIVGPATMTACVVLADSAGRALVIMALLLNLGITWLMLHYAERLNHVVLPTVARAFGKVMSLFLGAIAVAMLRQGMVSFLTTHVQR